MMMDLKKFFDEKDLPYKMFEIQHEGKTHLIDSETVISLILSTKGEEKSRIAGMLFSLDIRNAPIMDYLEFLANRMIQHTHTMQKNG